jgi:hypothetical protein
MRLVHRWEPYRGWVFPAEDLRDKDRKAHKDLRDKDRKAHKDRRHKAARRDKARLQVAHLMTKECSEV